MPKIERLPSGTYRMRISTGKGPDGKYHTKTITAPDRASLRRKIAIDAEESTLAPWLLDAIADYIDARKAVLSPYTIKGYRNIEEALKKLPCARMRCDMGASAYQKIISDISHLSPKTIRNYAGLIAAAVKFAGYTFPGVALPQKQKRETYIPDESIMRATLEAVKGSELEIPVALGMMGFRRGEVCALRPDDITGNTAHICRAAVDIDGEISTKRPKTYDSDRYIQLPAAIVKKIKKQGYVTKMTPDYLSHRFSIVLAQNSIPHYRFHDLRHFFVSYCHNVLKLSDAQIQKMGGWSTNWVMRQHYLQSMRDADAQKAAAEGFATFFV